MTSIKEGFATPLESLAFLDETARRRLAALSITTTEEFVGLITADPERTASFLGVTNMQRLHSDLVAATDPTTTSNLDEAPEEVFFTGAVPPDPKAAATRVDESVVEARLASPILLAAEGEPGKGVDLRACFGPIRHQHNRGTCVAHAVCALAECHEERNERRSDLSEQHLYWNAKQHDGKPQGEGTTVQVAMARVVADGVCLETTWPYVPDPVAENEGQGPPPAEAASEAAAHRLPSVERLKVNDPALLRSTLDGGRPIALAVPVFPNWVGNPMLKASGFIPMPLPTSISRKGHAMVAVGYDYDDEFLGGGYFILRNSWGEGFAAQSPVAVGHALMPFAYWTDNSWEAYTWASVKRLGGN